MQHSHRDVFRGDIIGREYIFLETATSTNDAAMEIGGHKEHAEGIVIVADSQTQGRGRMGRRWISPPGVNLYFTVLLAPAFPARDAPLVTILAAVAVVSAIREQTGLNVTIKWPNDIMINGKKAGGILPEMRSEGNSIRLLALGIGLNVNMEPGGLPEDIRQASTSLRHEKGEAVDRAALLFKILRQLEGYYKMFLRGDKRAFIDDWTRFNATTGKTVRVEAPGRIISGFAEGINEEGELLVRHDDGSVEAVAAGDVTVLKN